MGEFAYKKQEQQQIWADAQMRVVTMGMNSISLQHYAGEGRFVPRGNMQFGSPREITVNAGPLDPILNVKRENLANELYKRADMEYYSIQVRAGILRETAQKLEGKENLLVTYVSRAGRVSSTDGTTEPYLWNEFGSVKGVVKSGGKDCLEVMSAVGGGWERYAKPVRVLIPLEDITHVQTGYTPKKD